MTIPALQRPSASAEAVQLRFGKVRHNRLRPFARVLQDELTALLPRPSGADSPGKT